MIPLVSKLLPKGISTITKAIHDALPWSLSSCLCVCVCTCVWACILGLCNHSWNPKIRQEWLSTSVLQEPRGKYRWAPRIWMKVGSLWNEPGRLPRPLSSHCCFSCSPYCLSCTRYILSIYPCSLFPPSPSLEHLPTSSSKVYITANQFNYHNRRKTTK